MPTHRTPYAAAWQAANATDCRHSREAFDTLFRLVAERTDISPAAKIVHGAHVSMHRLGQAWTQTEIGEKVGLSRHQVWYAQRELIRAGLLLAVRIGLGQPNQYVLLGLPEDDLNGRASDRRPVRNPDAGRSGTPVRHSLNERRNEPKKVETYGYKLPPTDPSAYVTGLGAALRR